MPRCTAVPPSYILHGVRSRDLWQKLFLIHKSQKDQFKIHEQSVLQQPVISLTVGQWRHAATNRKVLPPLISQEDTQDTTTKRHARARAWERKVEVSIFSVMLLNYKLSVEKDGK